MPEALQPTIRQPLSLQQASILYVIFNLEEFSPDVLALLPLRFRRDLLLMLPPADIFKLEQTSVVDGIDMENEIWKEVYNRYDCQVACTGDTDPDELAARGILHLSEAMKKTSSSAPFSWKASFLSFIFTLLFHMRPFKIKFGYLRGMYRFPGERNYIFFLQLLFCTQFFTLIQIRTLKGFPLKVFGITQLLSRHHEFFFPRNEPLEVSDWIDFLLRKCHLEAPCSVTVDEQYFVQGVARSEWCENVMIRYKLNRVLQKLFLHPLLSLQELSPVSHHFHTTLKHVHITGFDTEIEMSTLCSLLVLLQNQVLETIFISDLHIANDETQQASLQQALESDFSSPISPTCTSITLEKIYELPFFLLLWLIQKFLYSPSNGLQILTLTKCRISYSVVPNENKLRCTPAPFYLACFHKSLHISNLNIEPAFTHALSCLSSAVLDSLHLDDCWNSEAKLMDFFDALIITDSLCKIKRIFYQLEVSQVYVYNQYITSLKPKQLTQIETLFDFAQQCPEIAITLHCVTTSYCVEAFLHCLYTEWKKSGGRKLDKLIIKLDHEPYRWSGLSDCIYSYSMLAKSFEVRDEVLCWIV